MDTHCQVEFQLFFAAMQINKLDTSSEAWRHECEVKMVASMPDKVYRMHYLAGVRRHRGDAAVERIKASLKELHQARMAA